MKKDTTPFSLITKMYPHMVVFRNDITREYLMFGVVIWAVDGVIAMELAEEFFLPQMPNATPIFVYSGDDIAECAEEFNDFMNWK